MKTLIRHLGLGLLAWGIATAGGCSGNKTIEAPPGEGASLDAKTRIAKDPRLKEPAPKCVWTPIPS